MMTKNEAPMQLPTTTAVCVVLDVDPLANLGVSVKVGFDSEDVDPAGIELVDGDWKPEVEEECEG